MYNPQYSPIMPCKMPFVCTFVCTINLNQLLQQPNYNIPDAFYVSLLSPRLLCTPKFPHTLCLHLLPMPFTLRLLAP